MMRGGFGLGGRKARGFTLAEVLVATFVLSIGLLAVATGFQYATSGVETGRGETQATFLAEQRLEQLKNLALTNWGSATLAEGTVTSSLTASRSRVIILGIGVSARPSS